MPDTALPVHAAKPILLRTPALAGFIARHVMSFDWPKWTGKPVPPTGSHAWLIEACRAELAWSRADYCRITGAADASHHGGYDGAHPSEAYRLPVERLAARVLNIHGHVHVGTVAMRQAIKRAKASGATTAPWEIAYYWPQRRKLWPLFVEAARAYRAARAEVDAAEIARAA